MPVPTPEEWSTLRAQLGDLARQLDEPQREALAAIMERTARDDAAQAGTIYALADPRDWRFRWIDTTTGPLDQVLADLGAAPRTSLAAWLGELAEMNLEPQLVELEAVTLDRLEERCLHWIVILRSQGAPLLHPLFPQRGR
jgi:hypothetical protein